jgi:threonine dehydratase
MFPLLSELADEVVLVSERAVRAAVRSLALGNRIVAEPSGALALAAALATPASERGESVCLVTGGSIDRELLVEILSDDAA